MNSTGDRLSPWGVPIVVLNIAQLPFASRGSRVVSANNRQIIRSSESSSNVSRICINLSRLRSECPARIYLFPVSPRPPDIFET